ncbi:cytidylyltransferase domain-containing protein [Rhodoligotrophos defluvii]|uniref:acylneuraminate cytidylyltransferase family protein n=1 Tax=Rhodoligotrophos defluvii TaxID=2561934 RepID=UPI0010C99B28|nr:acylneuraminate cytidylyltransferase family protein [Rhodoligotrophos defluvii]
MIDGRRILVVVPARGGSQGIKLKNLREVGGMPLVARVGHVVRELPFVDRAVVSTDHEQIAEVAMQSGLAAPFRRPEALSGPRIGDLDVLTHALAEMERLDGCVYDVTVMLQPTSPTRTPAQVERAIRKLIEEDLDAVWTVSETDSKAHPLKQLTIDPQGTLSLYDQAGARIIARQQLQPVYHRNGIAYVFTRQALMQARTILPARTGAVLIEEPVANIDTELDLAWANFLLTSGTLESN